MCVLVISWYVVSKQDSINAMFKTVMDEFGTVDVLVNNAGKSARVIESSNLILL